MNRTNELLNYSMKAEKKGDYATAAVGWFALGTYRIATGKHQNNPRYRKGITELLRSLYCDVRAQNMYRARRTGSLLREHIDPLLAESECPAINGLGYEWFGDSYLFVGSCQATEYYRLAKIQFEKLDLETQLHWGARPEYDTIVIIMQQFCDDNNITLFEEHDLDFAGRVEWKLEICKELLDST